MAEATVYPHEWSAGLPCPALHLWRRAALSGHCVPHTFRRQLSGRKPVEATVTEDVAMEDDMGSNRAFTIIGICVIAAVLSLGGAVAQPLPLGEMPSSQATSRGNHDIP